MFFRSRKHSKIGPYGLGAVLLITLGVTLRVILIANGWPLINSDEAAFGLQALHILTRGERPIVPYGINYLSTIEAYLGAFFFWLFGPSTFALRLSLVVLYAMFLLALYLLASLLYTKRVALVCLFLLCWGSKQSLLVPLLVTGGRLETLLFGTLSLLLASWLTLSFHSDRSTREQSLARARQKRLIAYGCLGGVIGLGIWSDMLILPFVLTSLLLLLLFCHRELRTQAILLGVLGFLIGAFPLFLFNMQHLQNNSLLTLWQQYRATGLSLPAGENLGTCILGTILITIPTATGANPLCPISEPNPWAFHLPLSCIGFQACWGYGAVIIWVLAVFTVIKELLKQHHVLSTLGSPAEKEHFIRGVCQLMLLASAALTVLSYATSPNAAVYPVTTARYLIGLTVATPAIVAFLWPTRTLSKAALICLVPLWMIAIFSTTGYLVLLSVITVAIVTILRPKLWLSLGKALQSCLTNNWTIGKIADGIKLGLLCFISTILILGMINTFFNIPDTQKLIQRQNTLINTLLSVHAPHIYSDYWTCLRLIFLSNERITCSVLNTDLSPGWNRYQPYAQIVEHDPRPAYVFDVNEDTTSFFDILNYDQASIDGTGTNWIFTMRFGGQYHHLSVAGFMIYLPADQHIPSE